MRTRKHSRRHSRRHRGGGWFDGIQNSWTGLTQRTKSWWSRLGSSSSSTPLAPITPTPAFKPAPMPAPMQSPAYGPSPPAYEPPMPMGASQGGRRRRRHRKRGGNSLSHVEKGSLALHAATYNGAPTAQPQAWTGGTKKSRRSRHRRR